MDGQTEDHTPEDDVMDEIGGVLADLIADAVRPLIQRIDALEQRVSELEQPVRRVTLMEPEPPPVTPLGNPGE